MSPAMGRIKLQRSHTGVGGGAGEIRRDAREVSEDEKREQVSNKMRAKTPNTKRAKPQGPKVLREFITTWKSNTKHAEGIYCRCKDKHQHVHRGKK